MVESPAWGTPPEFPALDSNDLHVWKLDLAWVSEQSPPNDWLSADENQRACRFRDDLQAARFIKARSALRRILGGYLDADPRSLRFQYGPRGKPGLGRPHDWLGFNLSHSSDLGLVAVTGRRGVGVDLEKLCPRPKMDEIARRVFTPEQFASMNRARSDARLQGFFENWTALEARLKARGLSIFERGGDEDLQKPLIRHFHPHIEYLAAVAVTMIPSPPGVWKFFSYQEGAALGSSS